MTRLPGRLRGGARALAAAGATAVVLAVTAACGDDIATRPRKLSAMQVADRARPATVWILVETQVTAEVPGLEVNAAALQNDLADETSSAMSPADLFHAIVNLLLANPDRYLVDGEGMRTATSTVYSLGSGVIVTPDGYVVTNAHVVEPGEEEIKRVLGESIEHWIGEDVAGIEAGVREVRPGSTIRDEAKQRLAETLAARYARTVAVRDLARQVYAVTGYRGSADAPELIRHPCGVAKLGEPIPGKDVAILKMDGADLPTLELAPSLAAAGIRTGSEIHVVGFPGDVSVMPTFSLPSRLEPAQTTGHVSALRDMGGSDRWQVVETDTTVNHGNSGGPALDDEGVVIGLATFTLGEQTGINYVVSVDVVQEFLAVVGVKPTVSQYTTRYLQALRTAEDDRPHEALQLLRQLQTSRPGIRAVDDLVARLGGAGPSAAAGPAVVPAAAFDRQAPPAPRRAVAGSRRPLIVFCVFAAIVLVVLVAVVAANRS